MFAHMYAFIWYQECKSSKHSKILSDLNVGKRHNVSSHVKSETPDVWETDAWFRKAFRERVEENHIYDLVKPFYSKNYNSI